MLLSILYQYRLHSDAQSLSDTTEKEEIMDFIRLGDATDYGDKVISASSTMDYDGRPLARKGDEVSCPKHPDVRPNRIIDGDDSMTDNGIPLARHRYRAMCGCRLISSLT